MNDARLCLDTILTSTIDNYIPGMKGANILNYTKFLNFIKKDSKITAISLLDEITNKTYKINCNCVINCTGKNSDKLRILDSPLIPKVLIHKNITKIQLKSDFLQKMPCLNLQGKISFTKRGNFINLKIFDEFKTKEEICVYL